MAASPEAGVGRVTDPPSQPPRRERAGPGPTLLLAIATTLSALLWAFPPFRIVPLKSAAVPASDRAYFEAATAALRIWTTDLRPAAARATELKTFARQLGENPAAAKQQHARSAGLGIAYYFVRGSGRVIARERNTVLLALDGAEPATVALRIGPVFGNAVRDGCGLLDVNAFPGLQEFNALAAELNALVEKNVIPTLREKAVVGAQVHFAGCAEAPETVGGTGEPLLTLIPVEAEVR